MGKDNVRHPYSAEAFARGNDLSGPLVKLWDPHWADIEQPARAYCSAKSLDALLVVAKSYQTEFFGTGRYLRAVGGVVNSSERFPMLHVFATVGLIDCSTGKLLAERSLGGVVKLPDRPVALVPADVARTPISNWSPELETQIRQALIDIP